MSNLRDIPVRFSHLKAFGRSAAHGHLARTSEFKATKAMLVGTAVHAVTFGTKEVAAYDGVRRGKAWEEFRDGHPHLHIMSPAEYYDVSNMASALKRSDLAMDVLRGVTETTVAFDWYGRKCRATPDVRQTGGVTDLKTTVTSDPAKFMWQSAKMGYHAQLRMQQIACGLDIDAPAHIVAVESKPPYPVTVFRLTEDALMAGEKLLFLWMEKLKACEDAGEFPGYAQSVVELGIPGDVELDFGDDNEE